MRVTKEVADILDRIFEEAAESHYEYVTPEQLLYVITWRDTFREAFGACNGDIDLLQRSLKKYLDQNIQNIEADQLPEMSDGLERILHAAQICSEGCGKKIIELSHLIYGFYSLRESHAVYYMESQGVTKPSLLQELGKIYEEIYSSGRPQKGVLSEQETNSEENNVEEISDDVDSFLSQTNDVEHSLKKDGENIQPEESGKEKWKRFITCLNDQAEAANPLIGREEELERTIQILCRKDKNNPLHIGEPGVGKTAITYGLARLLNEGKVPKPLKQAKIYSFDLGNLLAGTQYRGDFEKRFQEVMNGIAKEESPIVYIDEIHNIVGAGATGGSSYDVSNMLKPYLANGKIRFIGATTHEEYKKYFEKSKSLVRRFQNVEIKEPSKEDAIQILDGLKKCYEQFHGVKYGKGVLEYAVSMSARYVSERYLPDKAIDLIDEAGAYRRLHPLERKTQTVGKDLIDEILSKTCHIPKQVVESDEIKNLATLEKRLLTRVFGQEEAIKQVVNAVKFSRAGLSENAKPLASLLFVGPTGVGKTEIAKCLAEELGIHFLRFDMSEYEEKHAVAKLIGSPAGYVGYEEGGLLTEEIRKHPHAVLLLDEIEKAHPDIFNILLQAMDYATLTDNQGRKADFRNVFLIMTSNAGASQVGKAQIGFGERTIQSDAMMDEIKKLFQPEFRNRLNKMVVFNGMNESMAKAIVGKKLKELSAMLAQKKIEFTVTEGAKKCLLNSGISQEYGAREIERVIGNEVKPLLVDEILFGRLKNGGNCKLEEKDKHFLLHIENKKTVKSKAIKEIEKKEAMKQGS